MTCLERKLVDTCLIKIPADHRDFFSSFIVVER